MSSSSHNPLDPRENQPEKAWLEAELRHVPLPADLTARLKGIAAASDETIDAGLREVEVPPALLAQLKSLPADAQLDRRLREVPVPAGLLTRLHAISALADDEFDAQLRDVDIPATLAASLRGIVSRDTRIRRERFRLAQWALAASLLLATSVAYFSAAGSLVMAMFSASAESEEAVLALAASEPIELQASLATAADADLGPAVGSGWEASFAAEAPVVARVEVEFMPLEAPSPTRSLTAEVRELFSPQAPGYAHPLTDVFLAKHDFLATPVAETTTAMKSVDAWLLRGIAPPLVPGVDWQSLIVEGKHPLVSPAAHPLLATAQVPLSLTTLGYDLAWRELLSDRIPAASVLRAEDFLASQHYAFEPPKDKPLGLRAAAGPAPFSEPGFGLLQIGVAAQTRPRRNAEPAQVTLVIDGSRGMIESGRLAQLQRAISQWPATLTAEDRVSVVVLGETAETLLENGTRDDLAQLASQLDTHLPQGALNVAGGLRAAALLAREVALPTHRQRLVLVTDGWKELSPQLARQIVAMAADLAREQMPVDVAHVQPSDATPDLRLAEVARAGQGHYYPATSSEALRSLLAEVVGGSLPVVAKGAKLQVQFRPEAVAEYRLVGHEPTGGGGLVGGPLEINFQAGQVATALFELKLKGSADHVATATLTWIDAATGQEQKLQQRISRLQFATSVLESPVSLQRAVIAAQTAETLRLARSSTARAAGLRRVSQLAWQLPTHTRNDVAFQQLLRFVDLAVQVQTGRGAARP